MIWKRSPLMTHEHDKTVTNIMILSTTSKICYHDNVANLTPLPTLLFYTWLTILRVLICEHLKVYHSSYWYWDYCWYPSFSLTRTWWTWTWPRTFERWRPFWRLCWEFFSQNRFNMTQKSLLKLYSSEINSIGCKMSDSLPFRLI